MHPVPTRGKSASSLAPVSSRQSGGMTPALQGVGRRTHHLCCALRGQAAAALESWLKSCWAPSRHHVRAQRDAAALINSSYLVHFPFGKKKIQRERNGRGRAPRRGFKRIPDMLLIRGLTHLTLPASKPIGMKPRSLLPEESLRVPRHTSLRTTSQAVRHSKLWVVTLSQTGPRPLPSAAWQALTHSRL